MSYITVIDQHDVAHRLDAVEGWRIMEIIREHGLDGGGLCGGACACATCHVEVAPEWVERLYPATNDEEAMLDQVPDIRPTSRLSCQIIYSEALEGLALKLCPVE